MNLKKFLGSKTSMSCLASPSPKLLHDHLGHPKIITCLSFLSDKIFEQVRKDNAIQVVINIAENYKVVGQMLIAKRKMTILDTLCYILCWLNVREL